MVTVCCHWCVLPIAVTKGWAEQPCPRCHRLPEEEPCPPELPVEKHVPTTFRYAGELQPMPLSDPEEEDDEDESDSTDLWVEQDDYREGGD